MKLKSYYLSKNFLEEFLESKIHVGFQKSNLKKNYYRYLHGFRNNVSIIDLNYTFLTLKKFFNILIFLLKEEKKIVFIGFPTWFNKKWKLLEKISKGNFIFLNYSWELRFFQKNYRDIGLVFLFENYPKVEEIMKETKKITIPTAGFSTSTISNFDFPIIGNFNSKRGVLFFFNLLLNSLFLVK